MRIGTGDEFRRVSSISRTARGGRTVAGTARGSEAPEHAVGRAGADWASAPIGTARIPRMIRASARAGFITRIPLPTLPFIIVLPISGRSQADHTRMAAARLKERPYRTGGGGGGGRGPGGAAGPRRWGGP